ncbi:thioredoxin family protein [Thiolapillus sp.]
MRALLALLLVLSVGASASPRDPEQYFFDQSFGDYTEELQTAREQGKKGILIMFEMEECPFCHRMKTTVLNQPEVQDYYKEHFLIFSVDVEGGIEITDFKGRPTTMKDFAFKQLRVRATPVFQFFDLQGEPIKGGRYTGATKDSEEFMLLGKYIVEQEFLNTSFTRYKREAAKH